MLKIFEEEIKCLQESNKDEDLYKTKEVQEFTQTVWNLHYGGESRFGQAVEDDELRMTAETQRYTCPITKVCPY